MRRAVPCCSSLPLRRLNSEKKNHSQRMKLNPDYVSHENLGETETSRRDKPLFCFGQCFDKVLFTYISVLSLRPYTYPQFPHFNNRSRSSSSAPTTQQNLPSSRMTWIPISPDLDPIIPASHLAEVRCFQFPIPRLPSGFGPS